MSLDTLESLQWCNSCLVMSTRPRISFDAKGRCNACVWAERKKSLNWDQRETQLLEILEQHKHNQHSPFNCLVPVSGGKDGSYVAHQLKHKYGMTPLTVTVTPPLALQIGDANLKAFLNCNYNHLSINCPSTAMQKLNKFGLTLLGSPYFGWLTAIHSAVYRIALQFNIQLIFYGEDGEIEYGGGNETENQAFYDIDFQRRVYLEGGHQKVLELAQLTSEEAYFFKYPKETEQPQNPIKLTHWSYFENWDPYRNYLVAKEHCGLQENSETNSGTFTNFSQNDQALYALHAYLMYLKFGFGRANQDACIEIRRGAMDRRQALNLVKLYDGQEPVQYRQAYLEYYDLTDAEFQQILDSHTNPLLFEKKNNGVKPLFTIR